MLSVEVSDGSQCGTTGGGRFGVLGGEGGPHSEAETEQPEVTERTLRQDYLPHATAKHADSLVLRLIWRSLEFRVRSCEEK